MESGESLLRESRVESRQDIAQKPLETSVEKEVVDLPLFLRPVLDSGKEDEELVARIGGELVRISGGSGLKDDVKERGVESSLSKEERIRRIKETFYRPTKEAVFTLVTESAKDIPAGVEGPMIDWLYRYWYMEPGSEFKDYYKNFLRDKNPLMQGIGVHGFIAQKVIEASVGGTRVDEEDVKAKLLKCAGSFATVEKALKIQMERGKDVVVIGKPKGGKGVFNIRVTADNVTRAAREKEILQKLASEGIPFLVGFFREYARKEAGLRSDVRDDNQSTVLDFESLPLPVKGNEQIEGEQEFEDNKKAVEVAVVSNKEVEGLKELVDEDDLREEIEKMSQDEIVSKIEGLRGSVEKNGEEIANLLVGLDDSEKRQRYYREIFGYLGEE